MHLGGAAADASRAGREDRPRAPPADRAPPQREKDGNADGTGRNRPSRNRPTLREDTPPHELNVDDATPTKHEPDADDAETTRRRAPRARALRPHHNANDATPTPTRPRGNTPLPPLV